jgi:hypothetical protein
MGSATNDGTMIDPITFALAKNWDWSQKNQSRSVPSMTMSDVLADSLMLRFLHSISSNLRFYF